MSLIREIEAYLARTGMLPTNFSYHAVGDKAFLNRLRKRGDDVLRARTVAKLRDWMEANPDGVMTSPPPAPKAPSTPRKREYAKNRQHTRIDDSKLTRIDSRACFNCGNSGYAGCNCHRPVEILRGVAL
jgi:hypothetical protein